MDLVNILFRTFIFYVVMNIFYRIMGKREIGELKVIDLVLSMLLADVFAIGIENYKENIFMTFLPVLLLVFMQIIVSKYSFKYEKVRKFIDGEPSIIINRGKVNFQEMLKQRYNLDDLLMELRSQGIKSIEEVFYAVLEVSGRLSVFTKDANVEYPLPVILDGKVDEEVLYQIGKNNDWLDEVINKEGYSLKEIFYAFYRNNELFIIKNQNK
ncbi:MAG: DUF421 domain-containing protein [Bacilli bacterium]|nr:DUF421 domain-containing protein [Bacilli bacterium]